jgi:hypothetical protein
MVNYRTKPIKRFSFSESCCRNWLQSLSHVKTTNRITLDTGVQVGRKPRIPKLQDLFSIEDLPFITDSELIPCVPVFGMLSVIERRR